MGPVFVLISFLCELWTIWGDVFWVEIAAGLLKRVGYGDSGWIVDGD